MAEKLEYGTTGKPHPYHIVRPSVWPLVASIAAGILAMGGVLYMHDVKWGAFAVGFKGVFIGLLAVLAVMFFWWKDIIFETVTEKAHNPVTEIGMRYGMSLFIASEVMFFFAFFWAFFSGALYPGQASAYVWPPAEIHIVNPFDLPFLMTLILLLSGCTVTWAHHAVLEGDRKGLTQGLGLSVILGIAFLCFQIYEYTHMNFGFADSFYSSAFYMATGFHGFHVFVGTVFLWICWLRAHKGHFTPESHFGFEAAAWYWHFVDVVWLFLFIAVYVWGNTMGTDHSALYGITAVAGDTAAAGH